MSFVSCQLGADRLLAIRAAADDPVRVSVVHALPLILQQKMFGLGPINERAFRGPDSRDTKTSLEPPQ